MDESQFRQLTTACDRVLNRADASLEFVAIPWLHVRSAHPMLMGAYVSPGAAGSIAMTARRYGALLRDGARAAVASWRRDRAATAQATGKADVLIVSWLVAPHHLQEPMDFYFGATQDLLAARGLSSLLVLRNQSGRASASLVGRAARAGTKARRMLPAAEEVATVARRRARGLAAGRRLRRVARDSATPADRSVTTEAARQAVTSGTLANLRLHEQIQRLCQVVRPRIVLTLYEGHAWERCVWHAARQVDPGVFCVGYQHTTLWSHSHAVRRRLEGANGAYNPDLVLALGEVTAAQLRSSQALRGAAVVTFGTHRRMATSARGPAPAARRAVVVLPEGTPSESLLLFKFAFQCAERMPNLRFILRTHPVLPIERMASKLPARPPNVEVSREAAMEADFNRSAACLYRGSSTAFYAVLAGLKPFYLQQPNELSIDPLADVTGWREEVGAPVDFERRWLAHESRPEDEARHAWNAARAHCDRYAVPYQDAAIDQLLQLAGISAIELSSS